MGMNSTTANQYRMGRESIFMAGSTVTPPDPATSPFFASAVGAASL
jgi:carbonic anhydrase/acetyltransferase-like protein (isoleucine patch superfamily)